jgi:alpha-glucosidase
MEALRPPLIFAAVLTLTQGSGCDLNDQEPSGLAPGRGLAAGEPVATVTGPARPGPSRHVFSASFGHLVVEFLDDDLAHYEFSTAATPPAATAPIYTSPMIAPRDLSGPSQRVTVQQTVQGGPGVQLATEEIGVEVDSRSLCATTTDLVRQRTLHTICPRRGENDALQLVVEAPAARNAYGLGEQFVEVGSADGDWIGRRRSRGVREGNAMVGFNGGGVGNAQFPVLFELGAGRVGSALFLDHARALDWDLRQSPWRIDTSGDAVRWFVMTGPDLPDLRGDYMELVGRPLVPPRKMFGLWISEYGFDSWAELEDKLRTLRERRFPVDGFVMDLQWFGGVVANSDDSSMGRLRWDERAFPDPAGRIARLAREERIGLMLIEESYVSRGLEEHADLAQQGFLARDCSGCAPTYLTQNPWWGKGGMIDWSNGAGADYWHDRKRQPLVDMGILGHWCDLGEPEMYSPGSHYAGLPGLDRHGHADIHNLFSFLWLESIYRGYARHGVRQRPFLMARSGAPGIQRFGGSMWSGDIGSNLSSLATHFNVQMHMSLSGIDYFGADIGGFHRAALEGDLDEMYTQWFASGMALDIPGRVHTENLQNRKETAPDRIGHRPSNLASVRLRYSLIPYLYSLAHRAHRFGEPIFPPPFFYYPEEPALREIGHQKLIGRDLLLAIVARHGETQRDVYLPAGAWYDFHTRRRIDSRGQWLLNQPEYRGGTFHLPLFARAGAIVPMMGVDAETMDAFGHRRDGSVPEELRIRVFAGAPSSEFTLFEDDGTTTAYLQGAVRETRISQNSSGSQIRITVDPARGSHAGALAARPVWIDLVTTGDAVDVRDGTVAVPRVSATALARVSSGHALLAPGLVRIVLPRRPVGQRTTVTARLVRPAAN